MASNQKITCPISTERVDNNVTRIIAVIVLVLAITGVLLHNYYVYLFLTYDFTTRTFFKGNGSVLKWVGRQTVKFLSINPKPINAAPRKFAAGLGLIFSITIALLILLNHTIPYFVVGGILVVCAFMESVLGFCLGCYVYSIFVVPFIKNPEETMNA